MLKLDGDESRVCEIANCCRDMPGFTLLGEDISSHMYLARAQCLVVAAFSGLCSDQVLMLIYIA